MIFGAHLNNLRHTGEVLLSHEIRKGVSCVWKNCEPSKVCGDPLGPEFEALSRTPGFSVQPPPPPFLFPPRITRERIWEGRFLELLK